MDDKKLKELLKNFRGDLIEVPYDAGNEKRGIEKIGVMSDDSKKLYTLVFQKFKEMEELFVTITGENPYKFKSNSIEKRVFELCDKLSSTKDKESLNNLYKELDYLNNRFVENIKADLPKKYANSKMVYKQGWEIWYNGEKKIIFHAYWESNQF